MTAFQWPERVTLREVGLRDGLQSIARTLPTAQKANLQKLSLVRLNLT